MNPKYCLADLRDEKSANSQKNVFSPFDFKHVLNTDSSELDINFFNSKFDVVDSPYFSLKEILVKQKSFLIIHFLCFMSILEA